MKATTERLNGVETTAFQVQEVHMAAIRKENIPGKSTLVDGISSKLKIEIVECLNNAEGVESLKERHAADETITFMTGDDLKIHMFAGSVVRYPEDSGMILRAAEHW